MRAPADVVLLARRRSEMDCCAIAARLIPTPWLNLLGNALVFDRPADSDIAPDPCRFFWQVALGDARLAYGQRDAVPAGIYCA